MLKLALALVVLVSVAGCVAEERFNQLTALGAQQVVEDYAERCLRQVRAEENPAFFRRGFQYSAAFDGFVKDPASQEVQERWTVTGPGLEATASGGRRIVPGSWRVVAGRRDPTPLNDAAALYNQTIVQLAYGTASRPGGCS